MSTSNPSWGGRSHPSRDNDNYNQSQTQITSPATNSNVIDNNNSNQLTTTTITSLGDKDQNANISSNQPGINNNTKMLSHSWSKSHSRSINESMTPTPDRDKDKDKDKNKDKDHVNNTKEKAGQREKDRDRDRYNNDRKRDAKSEHTRPYHPHSHPRRHQRHTRELPYPSRSRSRTTSRSRSRSRSRSKSISNRSDSWSNQSDSGDNGRRYRRRGNAATSNNDQRGNANGGAGRGGHKFTGTDNRTAVHSRSNHGQRDNHRRHHRSHHRNRDRDYRDHRDRDHRIDRDNSSKFNRNSSPNSRMHRHHHRGDRNRENDRDRDNKSLLNSINNHNNIGGSNNDILNLNNKLLSNMAMNGINNSKLSSDKVPVSFKEFTNTMLEDDVTASEAQKRYEKYLQRFSKSDDVLFFEGHKDEEWFQERYDPIIIEKLIKKRREFAKHNYWNSYTQFLNDELPEIHDNVEDYKPLNTLNGGDNDENIKKDRTQSPTPIDIDDDTNTNTNPEMEDGEEGSTEATTTTVIGTNPQIKEEKEDDNNNSLMDIDNNEGESSIPHDGKLRLPKYCDIIYRDDYECVTRLSLDNNAIAQSISSTGKAYCYQNSIFIQGIPLHIRRESILVPFSKMKGFIKLILSDPIRNSRKVRYGWVTFDNQINCHLSLLSVDSGGLNGHKLTSQYFMNLLPKQKSKRRPKYSPPESLYPSRVELDIQNLLLLCHKFDAESSIVANPILSDKLLSSLSIIRRLNLLLLYSRNIHFLCYYCGKHFLSEEHMFARCSGTHERKVPADISLTGLSTSISSTCWAKDLDLRINDIVQYAGDNKYCWIERKQFKMLEKNTKKVSLGKFRCTICSKLFKAEIFVIKHIKNKHQDEIAKYIADQRLRTMFENYRRDRDRLTIKSFEDNNLTTSIKRPHISHLPHPHPLQQHHIIHHHISGPLRQPLPPPQIIVSQSPFTMQQAPQQMHHERAANIAAANNVNQERGRRYNNNNNIIIPMNIPLNIPLGSNSPNRGINPSSITPSGRSLNHNNSLNSNPDPYGRKLPVHFQDTQTRTRRSYREVDIEYPNEEIEEEIDYGFGDFVKNPTKFNL